MTAQQLNSYVFVIVIAVIVVATGVSAGCAVYIKKMELAHKPVPKQVIDVKTKADWLVSEASTILNITGAERKDWASNQLQQSNPNLTDAEARGAIQSAYDKKKTTQKGNDATSDSDTAQPIGFLDNGDDGSDEKA